MTKTYIHTILRAGRKFSKNKSGATAIEYALIASLVSVALITGAKTLGGELNNSFNCTAQTVSSGKKAKKCATIKPSGGIKPNTGGIKPNTGGIKPNTGGVKPPVKVKPTSAMRRLQKKAL